MVPVMGLMAGVYSLMAFRDASLRARFAEFVLLACGFCILATAGQLCIVFLYHPYWQAYAPHLACASLFIIARGSLQAGGRLHLGKLACWRRDLSMA
jgi:hypothetical protein